MGDKVQKKTYGKGEMFGYLVGMFGQNIIYQVVAAGLVSIYLGSVVYLPAGIVSGIIFIARIWDAINDPMMGTIVDKTHTKWGKCRPYLIFFPVIIGAITILCFMNGRYDESLGFWNKGNLLIFAWAAISYIVWGMLFTVCDIPLWGITSLMTDDENDRSKIIGLARMAAGIGGIGTAVSFIPGFLTGMFSGKYEPMIGTIVDGVEYTKEMAEDDKLKAAWIATVVVLTVLGTLCFQIAGLVTRERVPGDAKDKRGMIENFKIMFACHPFRQILISGVIRSPLQLLMILAMPLMLYYYTEYNMDNAFVLDGGQRVIKIALIAIAVFVPQFAAMALTPAFVKKHENTKIYNFYSVVGAIPYALIFVAYFVFRGNLLSWAGVIVTAICIGLASASMGGINVMQSIMIADCVDYEEYHKGYRPDGVFFSGQSFLTKLSGGIAALIQGIVYTIVGFSGDNLKAINQTLLTTDYSAETADTVHFYAMDGGKYAMAMFFLISVPVAIGMLLSAIPMRSYGMTDAEHSEMLEALVERRKETADGAATEILENATDDVEKIGSGDDV
ncbi:MAG: MFS transporter [Eubacterium sp.]|nr:MFS transporter [Eubacterium sp.]